METDFNMAKFREDSAQMVRTGARRCIRLIEEQRAVFASEAYAAGQPLSSFCERFACDQIIEAITKDFGLTTSTEDGA